MNLGCECLPDTTNKGPGEGENRRAGSNPKPEPLALALRARSSICIGTTWLTVPNMKVKRRVLLARGVRKQDA